MTESRLAIAMALEGGIGIVHKNMTPQEQAAEVRKVKRYESGIITDPITISSDKSVGELAELTRINGISGVPVIDNGNLVGIVTNRDLRFETRMEEKVATIMTPKERLITVDEGADRDEVITKLRRNRIEKVLIVNDASSCAA